MAVNALDILAAMPPERQAAIEAGYKQLLAEVEGLAELRRLAGQAQTEVAAKLRIKQPSLSRMERQADMYLSTLRAYVEAIGGKLELVAHLPGHPPLRIEQLGDIAPVKEILAGEDDIAAEKPARRKSARAA